MCVVARSLIGCGCFAHAHLVHFAKFVIECTHLLNVFCSMLLQSRCLQQQLFDRHPRAFGDHSTTVVQRGGSNDLPRRVTATASSDKLSPHIYKLARIKCARACVTYPICVQYNEAYTVALCVYSVCVCVSVRAFLLLCFLLRSHGGPMASCAPQRCGRCQFALDARQSDNIFARVRSPHKIWHLLCDWGRTREQYTLVRSRSHIGLNRTNKKCSFTLVPMCVCVCLADRRWIEDVLEGCAKSSGMCGQSKSENK